MNTMRLEQAALILLPTNSLRSHTDRSRSGITYEVRHFAARICNGRHFRGVTAVRTEV